MSSITLFTSGSTDQPKDVTHSWDHIKKCATKSIKEIGLTEEDRVLDVFPANTIAHYTITGVPAFLSGAQYVLVGCQKLDELAVDIDGMRLEVTGPAKRCVRSEVADSGGEQFLSSNRKQARLGLETTW